MQLLLGAEIGTQGIRGVVVDENLDVVARQGFEHNLVELQPGWAEHDTDQVWWRGFKSVVKELLRTVSAKDIRCISCSGIYPCLLPAIGASPLRRAILYNDTRAVSEIGEVQALTERLKTQTRNSFSTQSVVPKMLWLKKNENELYRKADRFFTSNNYITYKLTNRYVLDYAQTMHYEPLYCFAEKGWSEECARLIGLNLKNLPALLKPIEVAGHITEEAALECGLQEGTPVAVSSSDAVAEILSMGGEKEGRVSLLYGSSGVISLTTDNEFPPGSLSVIPHPVLKDRFWWTSGPTAAAILTKWFRDNFAGSEIELASSRGISSYELLSAGAESISEGSEGLIVLPYFSGERHPIIDPQARGVFLGLTTYHTRLHMYRALLEGVAYSFRQSLEEITGHGKEVKDIVSGGGGAKSRLWVQIVSDVTGYDQLVPLRATGADIGSAYMAGLAVGLIDNIWDLQTKVLDGAREITCQPGANSTYQKFYELYKGLYPKMKEDMHRLAELGNANR